MSKPIIVIADTDVNYIAALETKFLRTLDGKVQLEIITDAAYFQEYFATPKTAEIVVAAQGLYTRELHRHNIANLFVLTEEEELGSTAELAVNHIYKYTAMKEIFNELTYRSRDRLYGEEHASKETTVIGLYSAIGGAGKTSLGIGLAECLAQNHQRVLYINTESVQSFAYYLEDHSDMKMDGYRAIRDDRNHVYHNIRHFLRTEGFSYVPPFGATLDALNLDSGIFVNLVRTAKESRDFDYIIVDIESGYSRVGVELLEQSDKVLMVMRQDELSLYKTEYILRNLDVHDREKYLFICNQYKENKENAYNGSDLQKRFPLNEYVEYAEEPIIHARQLGKLNGIQKLAYMFI